MAESNTAGTGDSDLKQSRIEHSGQKPVIKEGILEKKGHSMAYFNWSARVVKVRQGELAYFKEDDLNNALNIIALASCKVEVKGNDALMIIHGSKKVYSFRIPLLGGGTDTQIKQERDSWASAIAQAQNMAPERRAAKVIPGSAAAAAALGTATPVTTPGTPATSAAAPDGTTRPARPTRPSFAPKQPGEQPDKHEADSDDVSAAAAATGGVAVPAEMVAMVQQILAHARTLKDKLGDDGDHASVLRDIVTKATRVTTILATEHVTIVPVPPTTVTVAALSDETAAETPKTVTNPFGGAPVPAATAVPTTNPFGGPVAAAVPSAAPAVPAVSNPFGAPVGGDSATSATTDNPFLPKTDGADETVEEDAVATEADGTFSGGGGVRRKKKDDEAVFAGGGGVRRKKKEEEGFAASGGVRRKKSVEVAGPTYEERIAEQEQNMQEATTTYDNKLAVQSGLMKTAAAVLLKHMNDNYLNRKIMAVIDQIKVVKDEHEAAGEKLDEIYPVFKNVISEVPRTRTRTRTLS